MLEAATDAIAAAGGVSACHRALLSLTGRRLDRTALYHWQRCGTTAAWVLALEHVSGVSRHRLRPDIYPLGETGHSTLHPRHDAAAAARP